MSPRKCSIISSASMATATRKTHRQGAGAAFGGIGYGWERDMLRLVLAVLFRAGAIEVSHGGEKFTSYQDPRCRVPFTNNTTFKSALFTPVKPIDLKTLTRAVESYETLTGETVDVDKNAIADALKRFAAEEIKQVVPIEADAKANRLPVLGPIQEYRESLAAIEERFARRLRETLAGGGTSLKESHDRLSKIAECLNEEGLATIRQARAAVEQMWPQLEARGEDGLKEEAASSRDFSREDILRIAARPSVPPGDHLGCLPHCSTKKPHADRGEQFHAADRKIKGRTEWTAVPESMRQSVLWPPCRLGAVRRLESSRLLANWRVSRARRG